MEQCARTAEDAQDRRATHKLLEARALLVRCARDECPVVVRRDCLRWLPEVDARVPSVIATARGPHGEDLVDVRVRLDDSPWVERLDGAAVDVDPGPHIFRFEHDGLPPLAQTFLVVEGEKDRRISVAWAEPAAPMPAIHPSIPWTPPAGEPATPEPSRHVAGGLVLAGGALVLLGVGTYFTAKAVDDLNQLRLACHQRGGSCDVPADQREFWIGDVSLILGGGAAAAAAWWFLWGPGRARTIVQAGPAVGGFEAWIVHAF